MKKLTITFLILFIFFKFSQSLKYIYLVEILLYLLKIIGTNMLIAFFFIICISIFLIINYIIIFKFLNIKLLLIYNCKLSLFFNNKNQLKKNKLLNLKPTKINTIINNQNNLSFEYLLILILITIIFLSIGIFSLIYFFVDSFLSYILYTIISLFLLYEIKLILQIIFLPLNLFFYKIIEFLKKICLITSPIISTISLNYILFKNLHCLYIKIVFILNKLDSFIFFLQTIFVINKFVLLLFGVVGIFFLFFLYFIFKKKFIKNTFTNINIQKIRYNIYFLYKQINNNFYLNKFNLYTLLNSLKIKKFNQINLINITKKNNLQIIKNFISFFFKLNFLIDINFKNLFGFNLDFFKLIEDTETISSSSSTEDNNIAEVTPLNFDNFNKILSVERYKYIHVKMIEKGVNPNQPLTDWFATAALKNTNGSQSEVDSFLEKNLNILIKNEREAQLKTHAFERFKPFLMHKIKNYPNSFPSIIPISNTMSDYEIQELTDAFNKEKDANTKQLDNKSETTILSPKS